MQRDEKVYDMYKRRVESGLNFQAPRGQPYNMYPVQMGGAYSGGVPSGGKYCTGDGFVQSQNQMNMTRRYENPPPYYEGNGRNCYTDYRHANKGVKKADMAPYADYPCVESDRHYRAPKKNKKPRKALSQQAKNKMKKGANEFLKFYRLNKDVGLSRHQILCAWHNQRPDGQRKIRKLKFNNCDKQWY
jgi:hypothetical protein